MKIFVCMDDTDQLEGPGTGHLAQDLCEEIEKIGWGTCSAISRHQLYVHDDIPYTSHNSAMCFEADIAEETLTPLIRFSGVFLHEKSAPGSDPGLCVSVDPHLLKRSKLTEFGQRAKQTVLSKKDAYRLATELNIHLSEHGGTGQGVVGALAGVGLRLGGNDGRLRGWYHLGRKGKSIAVSTLTSYDFIDLVRCENGAFLTDDTTVFFGGEELKTVLQNGKQVLLVKRTSNGSKPGFWITLTKQEVKIY
jgi:hypothetical protein